MAVVGNVDIFMRTNGTETLLERRFSSVHPYAGSITADA